MKSKSELKSLDGCQGCERTSCQYWGQIATKDYQERNGKFRCNTNKGIIARAVRGIIEEVER